MLWKEVFKSVQDGGVVAESRTRLGKHICVTVIEPTLTVMSCVDSNWILSIVFVSILNFATIWSSTVQVHFRKCCLWPWPLNPWPWQHRQCHQCHVDLVVSICDKFDFKTSMHPGDRWENAFQGAYLTICGHAVTLGFDFLDIKI